jgi:HEAT repeat protein
MPRRLYDALYKTHDGHEDLFEVMIMEPDPARMPTLLEALNGDDLFNSYQAALVLTAWGDRRGLERLERLVDERVHRRQELAPHRFGYDNVYDEIARAVALYGSVGGGPRPDQVRVFRELLGLYGENKSQGELARALAEGSFCELSSEIEKAIERSIDDNPYMASQLLPALAKCDGARAMTFVKRLWDIDPGNPHPGNGIADALAVMNTPESRSLLVKLTSHPNEIVAKTVRQALQKISR